MPTYKDAKAWEGAFLNKSQADCDMTFQSLYELYMEDCKSRLKPTTLDNKKNVIGTKILPYFSKMKTTDITPAVVRKWQNELMNKGFKPTYIKTINNQLSAMMNFAVKFYKLEKNPIHITGSIGKKNADKMEIWTLDEYKLFIEAISNKIYARMMFQVLFWTGIRSGELLALGLDDIDFESKTLRINKTYARLNCEDIIQEPKTPKSKRTIHLPDFLIEELKNYTSEIQTERLFPYTKFILQHEMDRGCKNSGVKKIRVHDLRHSHASLLIEMGFSPLLISERLGHEKVETTLQTYSHLYPHRHAEVALKFDALVRF